MTDEDKIKTFKSCGAWDSLYSYQHETLPIYLTTYSIYARHDLRCRAIIDFNPHALAHTPEKWNEFIGSVFEMLYQIKITMSRIPPAS